MFKQGDIVKFDFEPTIGHEQGGYRPALVISRELFCKSARQIIVCPITTKKKLRFPYRVELGKKTSTKGFVICDFVKTIDIDARTPKFVERVEEHILDRVLATVHSFTEKEPFSVNQEEVNI